MSAHDTTVHQSGDRWCAPQPDRWYMACSCGWVAPLRLSAEAAEDDSVGHLGAVADVEAVAV